MKTLKEVQAITANPYRNNRPPWQIEEILNAQDVLMSGMPVPEKCRRFMGMVPGAKISFLTLDGQWECEVDAGTSRELVEAATKAIADGQPVETFEVDDE